MDFLDNNMVILKKGFEFLKQIEKNNDRVWFSEHKSEYDSIIG
ncbi:MAG: DUF2461 family protein [Chryseobacterium sp.]|nr:MAG: DUF2461 family protein [Chryseobacterium sp.]